MRRMLDLTVKRTDGGPVTPHSQPNSIVTPMTMNATAATLRNDPEGHDLPERRSGEDADERHRDKRGTGTDEDRNGLTSGGRECEGGELRLVAQLG
jgi:hypothetical protein